MVEVNLTFSADPEVNSALCDMSPTPGSGAVEVLAPHSVSVVSSGGKDYCVKVGSCTGPRLSVIHEEKPQFRRSVVGGQYPADRILSFTEQRPVIKAARGERAKDSEKYRGKLCLFLVYFSCLAC